MGISILDIGFSGLQAAQAGLLTTGHNISNASTPGYNRQQIVQSTNPPLYTGSGFFGQGTDVQTVQRIYSQFLSAQALSAQTGQAQLDAYSTSIDQIDNLLGDASAGLSPALQDFFKSLSDVAADPASIPSRQSMLSGAQALVARLQGLDQRLGEMSDGVNSQIQGTVATIDSYAQQIAQLNQQIVLARAGAQSQQPNDLLDRRDQLVAQLNKEIRVTTTTESDGSFSVFVGNGQALVMGQQALAMQAVPAIDDPQRLEVAMASFGGAPMRLQDSLISGGHLGGLLAFRDQSLDAARDGLGRIAIVLAQTVNDQHKLGQDLMGNLGGDFFKAPGPPAVQASTANNGAATIAATLTDVSALQASDYRLSYNGGGNYTLVRLSDGMKVVDNAPLPSSVDGFSLAVSGAPNVGDSFLVRPVRNGARDIALALTDERNIAAAAPIRTLAADGNIGTGSINAGIVNTPPPPNAALRDPVRIVFTSSTTFDVYDDVTSPHTTLASGARYAAGSDISYNGWTVQISGSPAAGDTFKIEANTGGVSDNRNALALGQLQTHSLIGGTASYQSAYAQIVGQVGDKAREIQVNLTAQENLAKQAQDAQQSLSGVNLDEEAANLLRYQQAYQAAGKMIEIGSKLFDDILALGQ